MDCAPLAFCMSVQGKRAFHSEESAPRKNSCESMAVVIVIIPITIIVPAVPFFIPPTMMFPPATFACFPQLMALMVRLPAVPTVALNGFVQFVFLLGDTALALIRVIGEGTRRCGERQQAHKRGGCEQRPPQKPFLSQMNRHVLSILPGFPRLGWGDACFMKHAPAWNVAWYSLSDASSIDSKRQASKGILVHSEEPPGV